MELAEVKTERGRRTFGLPELAVYALRAQRSNRPANGSRPGQLGRTRATSSPRRMAARCSGGASTRPSSGRRLGRRPAQRFHDMRHAFATLLLDAGEEIAVISKMLGHADYSTTVDVYWHLSTERSRVAAARIDGLLKRRQAPTRSRTRPKLWSELWSGPGGANRPGPFRAQEFGRGGRI